MVFTTGRKIEGAKLEMATRINFPAVFSAIDCTHICTIVKPADGDDDVNRKTFCSVNVQTTCNASEYFTNIDAQWPCSTHDSRVLRNLSGYEKKN